MSSTPSGSGPGPTAPSADGGVAAPAPSGFDAFEAWKEYQRVAMHFNDLLMRLRSQSLAAIAAVAALAGVVLRNDVSAALRWGTLAVVFGALLLIWVGIWVLDFMYYNRLLIGAVDALLDLEDSTKGSNRVGELYLSSKIENAVAGDRTGARRGRLGQEKAKWAFYVLVFVALAIGFGISVWATGWPEATYEKVVVGHATPASSAPLNPSIGPAPGR